MKSLNAELKALISSRLDSATNSEILAITGALCAGEIPVEKLSQRYSLDATPTFEIVDDDVAINLATGQYWLRPYVPGGVRKWKEGMEAANKVDVRGWKWRAPTARELLTLPDYEKEQPAINTIVFPGTGNDFVWSSTSRGVFAFGVYFYSGFAGWFHHYHSGFLRAVRVGQF